MNIISHLRRKPASFLSRLLSASAAVWLLGVVFTPALAAAATPNPAVDQAPLIIQKPLPPNITLMLDDSGSMAWDVMPDYTFLVGTTADALVSSDNNGVYYNPSATYTPPPKADGTQYTASTFTSAWVDGFSQASTVNLSTYSGSSDDDGGSNQIVFTKSFPYTQLTSSDPACPKTTTGNTATTITGPSGGLCTATWSSSNKNGQNYYGDTCNSKNGKTQTCTQTHSGCSSGTYNSTTNKCVVSTPATVSFFTFTVANTTPVTASTTYTRHYVAANTGDCALASLSTANAADTYPVCDESTTTQQSVANWFSYYHTRILMAKSGLMSSFSTIDPTFRVGFGSINCRNKSGLPGGSQSSNSSTAYLFSDDYCTNNQLATVQPFGDGSAGTQKANFWSWVVGESAYNGTALRQALQGVGMYYQTAQPWQSIDPTSGSTVELACRQSYTILTTDGFWNGSGVSVGDVDGTAGTPVTGPNEQSYTYAPALPYMDGGSTTSTNSVNFSQTGLTSTQCAADYTAATSPKGSYSYTPATTGRHATASSCTYNYTSTTTTTVSYPNTLADVAMKYWSTDLRPNSDNEVPKNNEDPAFWQHMTTFTLGLGFTPQGITPTGTTVPQIFTWANGGAAIAGFQWPQPSSNSINNIADLAHAAVDGHGGFYSATSPQAFSSGLTDALKRASQRVGTGASLAANSTELSTQSVVYQANYYTAIWKGDLTAVQLDPSTGVLEGANWTASGKLPAFGSRNIYTYNPSVSPATAVAFTSPSTLSSTEAAALGSTTTAQQNMINYLRGDDSMAQSGGIYRSRETPLGDIVDSQPVYVGQPIADQFTGETFTGSSDYAAYAATTRQGLIFVAANDGMLHAFNADTGAETYAYLPAAVITTGGLSGGLATLSSPDYGATVAVPHQYFNDGELTVADVYFGSAWHSVAVGTTGRGLAKAVYALDVTNPSAITLLWEHSSGDGGSNSGYIGQMTGKPVIAQTSAGTWSVLIGNGYNSTNGVAALLQFALTDGTLTVHQTSASTGNGLAAPAVWIGDLTNGISTIAYAGDALGNLWSFGLNAADGTATPSSAGTALYTAKDSSGTAQPITSGMLLGQDPATGNLWVFFGTGQYLSQTDLSNMKTQTWYGLIVQSATSGLAITGSASRSALVQRSIIAETAGTPAVVANPTATPPVVAANAIAPARAITPTPSTPDMTGKSGWYIDLLSPTSSTDASGNVTYTPNATAEGERIVTPNLFQGNQLIATTRIPVATDICNPSGRGWIMSVNPFTGTAPSSSFFDLNGDGQINQPADYILVNGQYVASSGIGFNSLPNNPIFVGGSMLVSFDNGNASSIKTSGTGGTLQRVSWRELISQ